MLTEGEPLLLEVRGNFSESLPEKVTLSSSGPAGDIHPRAMGVYNKLSGLTLVWENSINNVIKLSFDGKNYKE